MGLKYSRLLFQNRNKFLFTKPPIINMKKIHFYFDPKEGEEESPAEETATDTAEAPEGEE